MDYRYGSEYRPIFRLERAPDYRMLRSTDGAAIDVYPLDGYDGPASVRRPYYPEHLPLIDPTIPEPDWMWTMQETSGSLFDICNNPAGLLSGSLNTSYQNTVTGWTSKWVGITAEGANSGFLAPISKLWDIGAGSLFVVRYSCALVSGGNRCFWLGGGNGGYQEEIIGSGLASSFVSVRTTGSYVYENATPTPNCHVTSWDRRGAGVAKLNTEKEEIVSTWVNLTDNVKGLGSNAIASPTARHNLMMVWAGTKAETMMDRGGGRGGRQIIVDLGWTVVYP